MRLTLLFSALIVLMLLLSTSTGTVYFGVEAVDDSPPELSLKITVKTDPIKAGKTQKITITVTDGSKGVTVEINGKVTYPDGSVHNFYGKTGKKGIFKYNLKLNKSIPYGKASVEVTAFKEGFNQAYGKVLFTVVSKVAPPPASTAPPTSTPTKETPTPQMPQKIGITVSGYVKDISGNPISGAKVYLGGLFGLSTHTDSSGYYEFEVAKEERDFELIVEKQGYRTEILTVHVSAEPVKCDVHMTLDLPEPVTIKFTLTVPYTQANDHFLIRFGKGEPAPMQRVNDVTWFYLKNAMEGDVLTYEYLVNGARVDFERSITAAKNERIYETRHMPDWPNVQEQNYQKVFDAIPYSQSDLPEDFRCSVALHDVWGFSFNWIGYEKTADYVDITLDRAKQKFNAEWVMLTSFVQWNSIDPSPELATITPGLKVCYTVTEDEMAAFVEKAHSRNMKVMLTYNAVFSELAPSEDAIETWRNVLDSSHSREWLDAAYAEWKEILVSEAVKAEHTGVDALNIWLHDAQWNQGGDYNYTSEKLRELISSVRAVYNGDVVYDVYNILSVNEPSDLDNLNIWDSVDFLIVEVSYLPLTTFNSPTISELQNVFESLLSQRIEPAAKQYGKRVMLRASFLSYDGALRYGWIEVAQPGGYPSLVRDWQEQADAYEALFRALEGKEYVKGVFTYGYWWDDAMDPFNSKMSPSVGISVRGKLAEAVLEKWSAR